MSKIYIVQSSCGEYEDYHIWNEKAFTNKEDAEKYAEELDLKHNYRPEFITPEFELAFYDSDDEIPSFEAFDGDKETYLQWYARYTKHNNDCLIKIMSEKGFHLTKEMIEQFEEWESDSYNDYHPCNIDEIELG